MYSIFIFLWVKLRNPPSLPPDTFPCGRRGRPGSPPLLFLLLLLLLLLLLVLLLLLLLLLLLPLRTHRALLGGGSAGGDGGGGDDDDGRPRGHPREGPGGRGGRTRPRRACRLRRCSGLAMDDGWSAKFLFFFFGAVNYTSSCVGHRWKLECQECEDAAGDQDGPALHGAETASKVKTMSIFSSSASSSECRKKNLLFPPPVIRADSAKTETNEFQLTQFSYYYVLPTHMYI